MKQTISHEPPSGFCQNVSHTDAFIEFLMWRHKAGATVHSAESSFNSRGPVFADKMTVFVHSYYIIM